MKIEISEFLKVMNPNIIDVRDEWEYESGHINNAINIPMEKLIVNPAEYLDIYKTYYLYCESGTITNTVCNILNKLGYKTIEISGGYRKWLDYKNSV